MQKLFEKNLFIIITLLLVGSIVHFKSFQMVPYGDDWKFIYNYYTHEEKELNFSNFPGIFSYLAPYGPAILAIGFVHQVFGQTYFVYYLIPLLFKIATAFILFRTLQVISLSFKQSNSFVNLLLATLFLVGFTGIQAVDWSMNMNVYIALFIFSMGLFFQCKYFINSITSNLVLGLIFFLLSIIIAPTRLTPLVVILPLIDLVIVFRNYKLFKVLLLKNLLFAILVYVFFLIGIFGNPGEVNNSSLINPFITEFLKDPLTAVKIFMHWIGVTILPIFPPSGMFKTALAGILFVALLISVYYKFRSRWLIIGSLIFFIPLFLMWLSASILKVTDADSRHLLVPFFGLTFLTGLIFIYLGKAKNVFVVVLLILISFHIYSLNKIYTHWISVGRGYDFIIPVQEKIMKYFPSPLTGPKIIFLDFDDAGTQQSIVFGIGYRIAFLSGTRNINFLPTPFNNKAALLETLRKQISTGKQKNELIDNIYAFQLRKNVFTDITFIFQEELRKEI